MVEGEIFLTRPDLPWPPPSLLCNANRVLPGLTREESGQGVALTTHPYLELRIKKEQSYTSLPFCAFIARSRENLCLLPSVSESTKTLTAVNKGETLLFPVLCASRRESEGRLAAGGLRVLGRYKHHRILVLYRKRSCWKPPLVESTTARMSVNCRCLAEFVALRLRCGHTGTASM